MINFGSTATIRSSTASRHAHEQSYSQQDFDDIFSSMFGQQAHHARRQRAERGHDVEIEVAVFLEETLTEQTRTISYKLPVYNVFGMVESETPKTLNVKIPAGVSRWPAYSPERPGDAGRERRPEWRSVAGDSYRAASAVRHQRS